LSAINKMIAQLIIFDNVFQFNSCSG